MDPMRVLNPLKRPECDGHGIKEWANIAKVVGDDDKTGACVTLTRNSK